MGIAEQLSIAALRRLPELEARARRTLDVNRLTARELLATHPALQLATPPQGTMVAVKLIGGSIDALCRRLERYEVAVTDGAHFEMPEHFRIGLAGDPEVFREGCGRICEALLGWA